MNHFGWQETNSGNDSPDSTLARPAYPSISCSAPRLLTGQSAAPGSRASVTGSRALPGPTAEGAAPAPAAPAGGLPSVSRRLTPAAAPRPAAPARPMNALRVVVRFTQLRFHSVAWICLGHHSINPRRSLRPECGIP